jgi:UDP-2-acetamido-2-deoxy-ribo-hexuluronate aminotransferase
MPRPQGPPAAADLAKLEARLAAYTGARDCVALGSVTDALAVAMLALQIGPGDEVITSPFAPASTVEAITRCGATPVFVDIEPATCNINPWLVEGAISERTRAIVPVSLYGQPADMEEINSIALRHGLSVIENAAESFGATYRGNRSCNLSSFGCTSLLAGKALVGEQAGGAIFTRDETLARAVRAIVASGRDDAHGGASTAVHAWQPDDLQCANMLAKLGSFDRELAQRQRVAARFEVLFAGRLQRIGRRRDRASVFGCYTLVVDGRERIMAELAAAGIATVVHPLPLHLLPAYAHLLDPDRYPVTLDMAATVMSIPIGPELDERNAQWVAAAVLRAARVAVPSMEEW